MKMSIRTIDIYEEDPTGDRFIHLNDLLYFISKCDLDPPELIENLRKLYEPHPSDEVVSTTHRLSDLQTAVLS